jgi:hypothetical protein
MREPKTPNTNSSMPSANDCIAKGQRGQLHIMVPHHKNGKHLFSNNMCSNGMLKPPAGHDMTKDTRTWAVMNMTPPPLHLPTPSVHQPSLHLLTHTSAEKF